MPAELSLESGGRPRTVVRIHSPGCQGHFKDLMYDRNNHRTGKIDNPWSPRQMMAQVVCIAAATLDGVPLIG